MLNSKKNILEKAFTLFLTRSYDSVTIREIQEASRVSRGAIYHHFKSKEDIYEQVIKEYLLPAFSSYSLISESEKSSLQNTILEAIKNRQSYINLIKNITSSKLIDFYFFKFIFQATEHSKEFREQANLLVEKEFNGWRSVVQAAMRNGEIRSDIDIDYIVQWLTTAPFSLGLSSVFSNYIVNINSNDIRSLYLKFYSLLKKNTFGS